MDNPEEQAYLNQLYTMTQGDPGVQVSMYDIGAALGVEKSEAGALAESLIIQDLAELKTLSGGIAITGNGLKALDKTLPVNLPDQALTWAGTRCSILKKGVGCGAGFGNQNCAGNGKERL